MVPEIIPLYGCLMRCFSQGDGVFYLKIGPKLNKIWILEVLNGEKAIFKRKEKCLEKVICFGC
jgi:hypothetical protein